MWTIEYDNDTGSGDEAFWQWWTVTDGNLRFKCDAKEDAEWLAKRLNALPSKP